MNKLNSAIERFCIRHPNFGIPNLMLYIVISNVAIFLLSQFSSQGAQLLHALAFTLSGVLHGQIWRLVTFVLIPQAFSPLSLLLSCYFYYWIGSTLERHLGTAKFTAYYISGMVLSVIAVSLVSLLLGSSFPVYGATYVNFAMFLAFALLYPDAQVLLFFIIPIRMRVLAYIDLAFFAYEIISYFVSGTWYYAILPITGLLNFVVFFWPEICGFLRLSRRQSRQATRFHNTVSHQQRQNSAKPYRHKCSVCGRTDVSNPELQFRYCSQCAGYHCFCSDHIFSHVHFTEETP